MIAVTPDERTPAQIEADIESARVRLTQHVGALQEATSPEALASRGLAKLRGFYFDQFGGIRPDRLAMTIAGVLGYLVLRRPRK